MEDGLNSLTNINAIWMPSNLLGTQSNDVNGQLNYLAHVCVTWNPYTTTLEIIQIPSRMSRKTEIRLGRNRRSY